MSGPLRKSMDPELEFFSPFSHGRIDEAYDNLKVKLLSWPDEEQFAKMATIAGKGHSGASFDLENFDIDELIVGDAWKGGLGQIKEFGKLVFLVTGCSRGFTHEIVRTRVGAAYIQQTMRHTNMGNPDVRMPTSFAKWSPKNWMDIGSNPDQRKRASAVERWIKLQREAQATYQELVDADFAYQDARTACTLATETWIIISYDIRSWLDTYAQRRCHMFYPEMVEVMKLMKEAVAEKVSWVAEQAKIGCETSQKCTYMGTEIVEGWCPLPWAKENNRVWKSQKFKK